MGDLGKGIAQMIVIGLIAIPFALWKLVEIVIWFFSHVEWK